MRRAPAPAYIMPYHSVSNQPQLPNDFQLHPSNHIAAAVASPKSPCLEQCLHLRGTLCEGPLIVAHRCLSSLFIMRPPPTHLERVRIHCTQNIDICKPSLVARFVCIACCARQPTASLSVVCRPTMRNGEEKRRWQSLVYPSSVTHLSRSQSSIPHSNECRNLYIKM